MTVSNIVALNQSKDWILNYYLLIISQIIHGCAKIKYDTNEFELMPQGNTDFETLECVKQITEF